MKKAIKEFIIEEHTNACSEWKEKIEEKYPELFKPENEVGKWYKNCYGALIFVTTIGKLGQIYGYGISDQKEWAEDDDISWEKRGLTPATDKEVEAALMAEAKRRGFKDGVKINCIDTNRPIGLRGSSFQYSPYSNTLHLNIYGCVFHIGKWASIIEEEKPSKIDIERIKIVAELAEIKEKLNQIESKLWK